MTEITKTGIRTLVLTIIAGVSALGTLEGDLIAYAAATLSIVALLAAGYELCYLNKLVVEQGGV